MINVRWLIRFMSWSHVMWYRLTGGLIGGKVLGVPILLLTTIGRKTGKKRTTPVMFFRDDKDLVIVASNAGDDAPPKWWMNLQANPEAEVQVKREKLKVRAEKASPEHKKRLWPVLTAGYPTYDKYQQRTSRELDVVVLRPQ